MKRIKSIGLIITLIMMFFGCETVDKDPAGVRNVAVIPVISNVDPGIFDSKDLVNSYVAFKVDLPPGESADNAIIAGSFKDNFERVKLVDIASFPSTVQIVSGEVIQKLGLTPADVKNGDVFTLEVLTTAKGVTTRSNAALSISVACAFDNDLTFGSYHSVSLDWVTEGDITITADPDDPYTVYVSGLEEIEGVNEDLGPLVMHINPATFAVTADNTVLASDFFGYGAISYSGQGVYNSCDGSYTMSFNISIGAYGSQGLFKFNITRNP